MLLSTTTGHLANFYGIPKTIEMIKEAGFDAFDLTLFDMEYDDDYIFNKEGYREYALSLREEADRLGIVCNQSHAPFPSSFGNRTKDKVIYDRIVRSIEIASILGAKNIVVHPKQHLTYSTKGNSLILEEINVDFYRSLVPYCEKYDINVAVENMFQWDGENDIATDSTCGGAEEFVRYIDRIDSPRIVANLDLGHVNLLKRSIPDFIKTLGRSRLKALHVHDNDGRYDLHTLPNTVIGGKWINYDEVTKALAKIGYEGDLTFEADWFMSNMPVELKFEGLKFMEKTGRNLIERIESCK